MNMVLGRMLAIVAVPLLMFGCVLTPGKFVSTLTINADRTFAFSYKGEVIAVDMASQMGGDSATTSESSAEVETNSGETNDSEATEGDKAEESDKLSSKELAEKARKAADDKAAKEKTNKAIAAALAKEYGYKSAVYAGNDVFVVDYAVTGTLSHGFVFPYNSDAQAMFPFLAIELRQGNTVRVIAPGFANDSASNKTGMGSTSSASAKLDGTFTVDTNAEIVSQNNEDGATTVGARKQIKWLATPLSRLAPTVVLRLTQ